MLCSKPFRQGVMEYGCGQCTPCRINRRRVWTARLMLESMLHERVCFLTLTYDDNNLPLGENLHVPDYQKFLKRLRRRIEPERCLFYIAGEYGSKTSRPHYHVCLFGVSTAATPTGEGQQQRLIRAKRDQLNKYNEWEKLFIDTWPLGDIHVGKFNRKSAAYCAKHLTKGVKQNQERPDGRVPEFCRMSLRPAIGKNAIPAIAEGMLSREGAMRIAREGDVVSQFRFDGSFYPLGSYLKKLLREASGMSGEWSQDAHFQAAMKRLEVIEVVGHEGLEARRKQDARSARNAKSRQETRNKL